MDELKDGKLCLEELHGGLQKLHDSDLGENFRRDYPAKLGLNFRSLEEVSQLFSIIDLSCEDSISRAEWVTFRTTPRSDILVKLHALNPKNEVTFAAAMTHNLKHANVDGSENSTKMGKVAGQHVAVGNAAKGFFKAIGRSPSSVQKWGKEAVEERRLASMQFDRMDANQDGVLSLSEYVKCAL